MDRDWLRRNWWWLTLIGTAVIVSAVLIGLKFGIAISITFLLGISAIFFAARSLKVTQDSLRLTRDTTRPFLTYLIKDMEFDDKNDTAVLRIVVSNKGNLPAEKPVLQARQVSPPSEPGKSPMSIDEFIRKLPNQDELKKLLKAHETNKKKTDTTYFPSETRNVVFGLGPDWVREYQKSPYTAVAIVIFYQSMQREFETIRWFLCDKSESLTVKHKPIPEKDYFK